MAGTCHIEENTDGTAVVVVHGELGAARFPVPSVEAAYAAARADGRTVSYVRSRPALDRLVAFAQEMHG